MYTAAKWAVDTVLDECTLAVAQPWRFVLRRCRPKRSRSGVKRRVTTTRRIRARSRTAAAPPLHPVLPHRCALTDRHTPHSRSNHQSISQSIDRSALCRGCVSWCGPCAPTRARAASPALQQWPVANRARTGGDLTSCAPWLAGEIAETGWRQGDRGFARDLEAADTAAAGKGTPRRRC